MGIMTRKIQIENAEVRRERIAGEMSSLDKKIWVLMNKLYGFPLIRTQMDHSEYLWPKQNIWPRQQVDLSGWTCVYSSS